MVIRSNQADGGRGNSLRTETHKLLGCGSKSDKIDTDKLAELLRLGSLRPVYHGQASLRPLKELAHSYDGLVSDLVRVMNRIKAVYRGRAIRCSGAAVYRESQREGWLAQLKEAGVRRRTEYLYRQLDSLKELWSECRKGLLAESRKHSASKILGAIPGLGAIRVAQILAAVETPHRFRSKRHFWSYCGLAVVTRVLIMTL